MQAQTSR